MRRMRWLVVLLSIFAMASLASAASVSIYHAGGQALCTLAPSGLVIDSAGNMKLYCTESLGGTGTTPANAPSCTLTAASSTVSVGGTTTLSWTINNGPASISFSPAPGGTCSSSSVDSCSTGAISSSTNFALTVSNTNGSATCYANVGVDTGTTPTPTTGATRLGTAIDTIYPIAGSGENLYYLVTDADAKSLTVSMNAAGNYYAIDADLIISSVRQPRCSDIKLRYELGTNGMWYAPMRGSSSESLTIGSATGLIPAGTTIYATVCNRMTTAGKIQIYWSRY